VLDSVLEPVVGVELPKEVVTSRARWMSLIIEWNASANMFYLLKNLLLLIIVIFKLICNNLIFNEIIVLNASYVCLHAFSLRRESLDLDPRRRTPHFWGGSITDVHPAGENPTNMTRTLPMSVHVRRAYASYGRSSYVATFHTDPIELGTATERKCSRLHLSARQRGLRDLPQFLSEHSHWSCTLKPNICRQ
jgi:hypothetical protein